jgi:hypothetical protein
MSTTVFVSKILTETTFAETNIAQMDFSQKGIDDIIFDFS